MTGAEIERGAVESYLRRCASQLSDSGHDELAGHYLTIADAIRRGDHHAASPLADPIKRVVATWEEWRKQVAAIERPGEREIGAWIDGQLLVCAEILEDLKDALK